MFNVVEQLQITVSAPEETGDGDDRKIAHLPTGMQLITLWFRESLDEPVTGISRMVIRSPQGVIAMSNEIPLKIDGDHHRLRTLSGVGSLAVDLQFVGTAIYAVDIELKIEGDWELQASLPLQIELTVLDDGEAASADISAVETVSE